MQATLAEKEEEKARRAAARNSARKENGASASADITIEPDTTSTSTTTLDKDVPPANQKVTLTKVVALASTDFLVQEKLKGLSGNKLAKLKRSEYNAIWCRFCESEVGQNLTDAQIKNLLEVSKSSQKK